MYIKYIGIIDTCLYVFCEEHIVQLFQSILCHGRVNSPTKLLTSLLLRLFGNTAITFEDKSSPVIIRTPTLLRRYGLLTITFEDKSSPVIIRTPTLMRRYGLLTITFEDKSSPVHLYGVLRRHTGPPAVRLIPRTPITNMERVEVLTKLKLLFYLDNI